MKYVVELTASTTVEVEVDHTKYENAYDLRRAIEDAALDEVSLGSFSVDDIDVDTEGGE